MFTALLNRMKKDEKGFTLIELLVVILIIGILAAIALPTFLGQSDKAKDASAKSNARNAISQMESCIVDSSVGACITSKADGDLNQFKNTTVETAGAYYKVTATSEATKGGAHTYSIAKTDPGFVYSASDAATGKTAWAANGATAAVTP